MKKLWILALVALLIAGLSACAFIEKNVKSVVKISIIDEKDQPYGYVTLMLVEPSGKVAVDDQANERGICLIEGVPAGTYTFVVKNAAGIELQVLSPENVVVRPGKTVNVDLKVQSVAATMQYE